jgi:hypothetical protein
LRSDRGSHGARLGAAALLAAAGIYQIAGWLRAGLERMRRGVASVPVPAGAGEIRLDTEGSAWTLRADLLVEPGSICWLLLQGPADQVARATGMHDGKLVFDLRPGPPGTYRFVLVASKRHRETSRSLARKAAKALAAGEFRVGE